MHEQNIRRIVTAIVSIISRFPLLYVSTMRERVWYVPTDVPTPCFHKSGYSKFSFKRALHDLVKQLMDVFNFVSTSNVWKLCGPIQRKLFL